MAAALGADWPGGEARRLVEGGVSANECLSGPIRRAGAAGPGRPSLQAITTLTASFKEQKGASRDSPSPCQNAPHAALGAGRPRNRLLGARTLCEFAPRNPSPAGASGSKLAMRSRSWADGAASAASNLLRSARIALWTALWLAQRRCAGSCRRRRRCRRCCCPRRSLLRRCSPLLLHGSLYAIVHLKVSSICCWQELRRWRCL